MLQILLFIIVTIAVCVGVFILSLNRIVLAISAALLGLGFGYTLKFDTSLKKLYVNIFKTSSGYQNIGPRWLPIILPLVLLECLVVLIIAFGMLLQFNSQFWYGALVITLLIGGIIIGAGAYREAEGVLVMKCIELLERRVAYMQRPQNRPYQILLQSLENYSGRNGQGRSQAS